MMWDESWSANSWLAILLTVLILLWVGLAVMIVGLVRDGRAESTSRSAVQRASSGHADEILAERFVHGEIDEAEFTRRRQSLHNTRGPCSRVDQS
jgi:putative membrane protein